MTTPTQPDPNHRGTPLAKALAEAAWDYMTSDQPHMLGELDHIMDITIAAAGFSIVDARDMTVKIETLRRTAIMFGKTWSAPTAATMHVAERALHAALAERRDDDGG